MTRFVSILLFIVSFGVRAQPLIISIEGNCGSGKSTLSKILGPAFHSALLPGGSSNWIDKQLFSDFLLDKPRWACTLSFHVLTQRLAQLAQMVQQNYDKKIIFTERSAYTQLYVFSPLFFAENSLCPAEWQLFKHDAQRLIQMAAYKPHAVIYVRTPLEICMQRIAMRFTQSDRLLLQALTGCEVPIVQERAGGADDLLTEDFVGKLGLYHEKWLYHGNLVCPVFGNTPVLVVDGTQDFKNDVQVQATTVAQVKEFIAQLEF